MTDSLLAALAQGVRPCGRGLEAFRTLEIAFGRVFGQVKINQGDETVVYAGVAATLVVPPPERPGEGTISVSVSYDSGDGQSGGQISQLIEQILKGSRVIDPESLCLLAGKQVWALKVDIRVVKSNTDPLDSCAIACVCALTHFRRPEVSLKGTRVLIHDENDMAPVPVAILHQPILSSCSILQSTDRGYLIVADPSKDEEACASAVVSVAANAAGEICFVHKRGGTSVTKDVLDRCTQLAKHRATQVSKIIEEAMQRDIRTRTQ